MADLQKQPRPTQFTSANASLTPLQTEYIDYLKNRPSASDLYKSAREDVGIDEQARVVSGLNRSILDLEGKIKQVEPNVSERTKDFLVNEAQRQRRVNVEEQPLRDQYLESLRRREAAAGDLDVMNNLLAQRLGFAQQDFQQGQDVYDALLQFQKQNQEAAGGGGFDVSGFANQSQDIMGGRQQPMEQGTEQLTELTQQDQEALADEMLGLGGEEQIQAPQALEGLSQGQLQSVRQIDLAAPGVNPQVSGVNLQPTNPFAALQNYLRNRRQRDFARATGSSAFGIPNAPRINLSAGGG